MTIKIDEELKNALVHFYAIVALIRFDKKRLARFNSDEENFFRSRIEPFRELLSKEAIANKVYKNFLSLILKSEEFSNSEFGNLKWRVECFLEEHPGYNYLVRERLEVLPSHVGSIWYKRDVYSFLKVFDEVKLGDIVFREIVVPDDLIDDKTGLTMAGLESAKEVEKEEENRINKNKQIIKILCATGVGTLIFGSSYAYYIRYVELGWSSALLPAVAFTSVAAGFSYCAFRIGKRIMEEYYQQSPDMAVVNHGVDNNHSMAVALPKRKTQHQIDLENLQRKLYEQSIIPPYKSRFHSDIYRAGVLTLLWLTGQYKISESSGNKNPYQKPTDGDKELFYETMPHIMRAVIEQAKKLFERYADEENAVKFELREMQDYEYIEVDVQQDNNNDNSRWQEQHLRNRARGSDDERSPFLP